jgi:hypothetical protein
VKIIRNILIAIVAVVLLFVGLIFYSFSRTMPLKNLQPLSGGAFQIKAGFVSVGIIPSGDHQVIMVDCGNDAKAKDILATLAQVGLSQDSVRTILLTHILTTRRAVPPFRTPKSLPWLRNKLSWKAALLPALQSEC